MGKFDRVRWPRVEIFDSWFLVVGPFELFMALGREIFPRYVINYADILKQIFFGMASKTFFRLCVSRIGTSKKAIAAEGLLELLAKGKHKLCTNCMNYSLCLLFDTLLQTMWRLSTDFVFFVLYVFLKTQSR